MAQAPNRTYSFGITLHVPYDRALEEVRGALREQGFGVLTEIDVRQTLKEKLNADFRPYAILGACNPPLAHPALEADLGMGLLLPCIVTVSDSGDGTTTVEAMDPEAALGIVGHSPVIADVAREAGARPREVIARLGQAS